MSEPKVIKLGKNTRRSYSKIDEVLEMPNLIEVQKNSYKWFLEEGLREVFKDVSPIQNYGKCEQSPCAKEFTWCLFESLKACVEDGSE